LDLGVTGVEVYDLLRDEYGILAEFGDAGNVAVHICAADKYKDAERLIEALAEVKKKIKKTQK
jgi:arginine decarboxylase